MTDCFALPAEPPRPWLDADALKAKFLARSAEVHPDRVHSAPEAERAAAQERYTALNAAFNTLREPKDRLQHLLELELGAKPGGRVAPARNAGFAYHRVAGLFLSR